MSGETATTPRGPRLRLAILAPMIVFCVMALVLGLALRKGDPSRLPSALIGKPAPALALRAIEGLAEGGKAVPGLAPDDLAAGKVTLVNFWASWCPPCVQEHPLLMRLKAVPGLALVGINQKDQDAAARRFLGLHGNPFARVGADTDGRAGFEWGVYALPETFIVDRQGRIVFKHTGPLSEERIARELMPAIERALAEPGR